MISLVAGLGNPGKEYADTRHNAGFWLVDRLSRQFDSKLTDKKKFHAELGDAETPDGRLLLAKPTTYMNKSGSAVQPLMSWYTLRPEQLLVVHDELDLPAGTVRFKIGGGHGGHNGLRDIIRCIGTGDFIRLRIGIGHPGDKDKVLGHVLKKATIDERIMIDRAMDRVLALTADWQQSHWSQVMQTLHTQDNASK